MSTTYSRLIVILPRAPNHMVAAVSPTAMSRTGLTCNPFRISIFRAAQTFKQRPASLEPLTARGGFPPGLAMACSLRDSLQGSRGVKSTSPDPTNQLPTSHSGQAQRPPGGSTAHLQLFKIINFDVACQTLFLLFSACRDAPDKTNLKLPQLQEY